MQLFFFLLSFSWKWLFYIQRDGIYSVQFAYTCFFLNWCFQMLCMKVDVKSEIKNEDRDKKTKFTQNIIGINCIWWNWIGCVIVLFIWLYSQTVIIGMEEIEQERQKKTFKIWSTNNSESVYVIESLNWCRHEMPALPLNWLSVYHRLT